MQADPTLGILDSTDLKSRVLARLEQMETQGLITDEVCCEAQDDINSDDCEICSERKFSAVVRDVREETNTDRGNVGYYVQYVICDECMERAEHEHEPDPDVLYDAWVDRQMDL